MLFLASIFGLAAIALCIPLLFYESEQRRQDAIRHVHTRLVASNCHREPEDLYATNMIIGRWTRRCDISLAGLTPKNQKSPISKVHARLWWDSQSFRIAPIPSVRPNGTIHIPKVWVDMIPVTDTHNGMRVNYGQIITLGSSAYEFYLEDTSAEFRFPPSDNSGMRSNRKHLHFSLPTIGWNIYRTSTPTPPPSYQKATPQRRKKPRLRTPRLITIISMLLVFLILAASFLLNSISMPEAENAIGPRKDDTSAILLCGVDEEGLRTDTMMLVYISGSEDRIGLLSLPRDTLSVSENGKKRKLNAVYRGRGAEGAEELLDVVEKYIGYRPDGYLFFDWSLVKNFSDLMGGVEVELDCEIRVKDPDTDEEVYIPEGLQHLDGRETLATLRYRKGYYNADLGRIAVQRKVLKACAQQWVTLKNVGKLSDALSLLQEHSLTDLSTENLLWLAKTVVSNDMEFTSDTLAGYDEYRDRVSYYILSPTRVAAQINESYNPYTVEITEDMLDTVA